MRRVALALAGLLLGSCAVGPNYQRPQLPVPAQFYGEQAAAEARTLADLPWWEVFDDPVLKGLIGEALKNGYDARLAAARVEEARARYGIARSDFLPQAGYTAGWTRERQDQFFNPSGATDTKWTAKLGFSWELDLWGRIRRLNEAARARYLASEEARRGVLLSLASDVAIAYFELRELDAELEIARRTTAAFQDTYDLFSRAKTWSIAATLLGPLFTGGSVSRNVAATKAQWEQGKVLYEASVTNALAEVSTALVSRARLVETERQRARTVAAYREAVRLANLRYLSGLSAYFEVLESQQQLFPAEITLAQTRRNQLIAVVDLYRALGGGWRAEAP